MICRHPIVMLAVIVRPMLPLTPLGKVRKLDLYEEMKKELGK